MSRTARAEPEDLEGPLASIRGHRSGLGRPTWGTGYCFDTAEARKFLKKEGLHLCGQVDESSRVSARGRCLMEEEASFMDRKVAPVWSPSQAAAQREARRRSRFYRDLNLWPFVGI